MRPKQIDVTGTATSAWVPLDWRQVPFNVSLHAKVPAGNTSRVEYTPDDPASSSPAAFIVTGMNTMTSNTAGNLAFPVQAVRLVTTAGSGVSSLVIMQG